MLKIKNKNTHSETCLRNTQKEKSELEIITFFLLDKGKKKSDD